MSRHFIAVALIAAATASAMPAMAQSLPGPVTAVNVSIGGIGPGVDARAIKPNPSTTAYSVEATGQCVYPLANATP
jgi:hypothetical protein